MKREELTKAERWAIADRLAADRLPKIDASQSVVRPKEGIYLRFGKRLIDVVLSGVGIILTAPINIMLAVGTYLDVGNPIFYEQERVGKNGKMFTIVKFRNMTNERDERGELLPPDQRVTPWGRFVRKTSLDELLNLWCVFRGDMSIIGPRPMLPEYLGRFSKRHKSRLVVKPGLECPPHDFNRPWTWQAQFENDVWYVENVGFLTDVRQLFNLVRFAVDRKATTERGGAKRGVFMGYDERGTAITLDEVPQHYIDEVGRSHARQ